MAKCLASLCFVLLLLWVLARGDPRAESYLFRKAQRCPSEAATRHPAKMSHKLQCAEICADEPRCDAFHFDPALATCYLGDACSTLNQWTAGQCESFVYAEDETESSNPLLLQLRMKLFYKFRTSGLANEANPRQFCLKSRGGISVGTDGAVFPGGGDAYLSAETPGLERLLDYGNTYSIFVQVRHRMDPSQHQAYFRVQQCPPGESPGASFYQYNRHVYTYAYFTSEHDGIPQRRSQSASFLPGDNKPTLVSIGYSFNRVTHAQFYFNRTLLGVASVSNGDASVTDVRNFQCLTLGHYSDDAWVLNGTMYCFGLSSKLLGVGDFQQLETYCFN